MFNVAGKAIMMEAGSYSSDLKRKNLDNYNDDNDDYDDSSKKQKLGSDNSMFKYIYLYNLL